MSKYMVNVEFTETKVTFSLSVAFKDRFNSDSCKNGKDIFCID